LQGVAAVNYRETLMCDKAAAMGPARKKTTPIMLIKSQSGDFHFGEMFPLCESPDSGVI